MAVFIRFKKIDDGYLIIKTGLTVIKVELIGLMNLPGIDEFSHLGYQYTAQNNRGTVIKENEGEVFLELDVTGPEADAIVSAEPAFQPYKLTPEEAAALLPKPAEPNIAS